MEDEAIANEKIRINAFLSSNLHTKYKCLVGKNHR
jgi:hypothetical protein